MRINTKQYLAKPDKTIWEHNEDLKKRAKFLYDNKLISKRVYEILLLAIDNHDLGKANIYFQDRVTGKIKKFDDTKEVPHNILSVFLIDDEDFENRDDFYIVAYCVLEHHHYVDNYRYVSNLDNREKINNSLLPFQIEYEDLGRRTQKRIQEQQNNKEAILIKGFLHKCDYSASAENVIEYLNEFLLNTLEKWRISLGINWRPLQKYTLENADENCITIAQTGMGKTEAALLWIGNNKGMFLLPLKVSNNAIYERCKSLVKDEEYSHKVGLLHSGTLSYYNNHNDAEYDLLDYANITKNLSLPLTISTVDQIFRIVYQYPGYEANLATLSYSKVVIDEIQSYSPKITAALIRGIQMITDFGAKVHILTATLPPYLKDLITAPDENGNIIPFRFNKFIDDTICRHNIKTIKDKELNAKDVFLGYNKHKGKTLVICNTVKKAQDIYSSLKVMGIENIKLLHSKFTVKDRRIKEDDILKCGETSNKEDIIWVTTQIVEASLDIDFDYLYTEMSDLSSLFQRLGRVNRKGLKPCNNYNSFIYLKINEGLIGRLVDKAFYELSCEAISSIDGFLSESRKIELIDTYLTTEKLMEKDCKFLDIFKEEYKILSNITPGTYDKSESNLRDISSITFIPLNVFLENETEIEKCKDIIKASKSIEEKLTAKDKIMDFTVSVPGYDSKKLKGKVNEIQLSPVEFIPVYECKYSTEEGVKYEKITSSNFL